MDRKKQRTQFYLKQKMCLYQVDCTNKMISIFLKQLIYSDYDSVSTAIGMLVLSTNSGGQSLKLMFGTIQY